MNLDPVSVRPALRKLARRLAIGLFLDIWPPWAVASLLVAGLATLACRLFFPAAAPTLPWLWLAPILAAVPAAVVCVRRAQRPADVAALADSLAGGHGLLLAVAESGDARWEQSAIFERLSTFTLPRLRPWRRLTPLALAVGFLALALWIPQRIPPHAAAPALAEDIGGNLDTMRAELQQQQLLTPDEDKKLEEEIERIRDAARERVDSSLWEAADALREKVAADLSQKQDAVKWAEDAIGRYTAALQAGADAGPAAQAYSAELAKTLEKLAKSGMLDSAPAELQQMLKGGKLPTDAASLQKMTAALSAYLGETKGRMGNLAKLGKEFGRFDPAEFPLDSDSADAGDHPGQGAATRGRADASLTWGKESAALDRFKAKPLPPGGPRSPDDWAPIVVLPGAPEESPTASRAAASRHYTAAPGQSAWRRSLAPRHQNAVKKYFNK